MAFITAPMRPIHVARHFGLTGRAMVLRLASLFKRGQLGRPHPGWCAPVGMEFEPPPIGRQARIVAALDEPLSARELGRRLGVRYSLTHALQVMIARGLVVHCGKFHYARASLAARFAPVVGVAPPQACEGSLSAGDLRRTILFALERPRTVSELMRSVNEYRQRLVRQLVELERLGWIRRVTVDAGRPTRPAFMVDPARVPPVSDRYPSVRHSVRPPRRSNTHARAR